MQQLPSNEDTIVAVSTPAGRSGIGVVRLSGRHAVPIVKALFQSAEPFEDRRARYGTISTPGGECVDSVVVTVFQAPRSYTGEDVAEISAHGNPLILNEICASAVSLGARRAGPGEFTLRAVSHGKMDLAQAEAVRDFIEAQTEEQARTAMLQMDGALSKRVGPEKDALVGVIAELEAGIDFAEDDVAIPDGRAMGMRIKRVAAALEALLGTFEYGRLLGDGLCLAIAGKPNVGKSSLFNRLVSCDRAIVTDIPGTTRDVLTETVAVAGVPIRFADTAGLRKADETVEALGVTRAWETVAEADLTLAVLDGSRDLDEDDRAILGRLVERPHLVVVNKQDLPARWESANGAESIRVSARTGAGLDRLKAAIANYIAERRPPDTGGFYLTSARQRDALECAVVKLGSAAAALETGVPHEMVLLDLYAALTALGELTGEVATEDILDKIFSTFCIGK